MQRMGSIALLLFASVWVAANTEDQRLAERSWQLTDVILENHVNPPARQAMLLAGVKSLLKQARAPMPADLSQQISRITTLEQWETFLSEMPGKQGDQSVTAKQLGDNLIGGLLQAVPGQPHQVSAAERKAIEGFAGNRYVGTGVQIKYSDEKFGQLVSPLRNGPAHRAGAKPGDLILEIDGKNAHDIGLKAVVELLRGDEGSDVTLVVRQPNSAEKRTLKITRGVSPVETVLGFERIENENWKFRPDADAAVGYLAIGMLNSSTLHELRTMVSKLQSDGAHALVLDLRFAQGGSAHHAALVADALLDGGLMWMLRDAKQNIRECRADRDCHFRDWPLVVLVDQTTGSAAGWIAGALQDNGRAVVVGQTVVRDGYTRSFVDLPGGENALEMPTGLVERGMTKKSRPNDSDEDGQFSPSLGWVLYPDHVVAISTKQRSELHQWLQHKSSTEPPAGSKYSAAADLQLSKAIALAREKIEDSPARRDTKSSKGS